MGVLQLHFVIAVGQHLRQRLDSADVALSSQRCLMMIQSSA